MTLPTPPTPEALEKFADERNWSAQRLADEIYDRTHVRLSLRTLMRYMRKEVRPTRITVKTLAMFREALNGKDRRQLSQ